MSELVERIPSNLNDDIGIQLTVWGKEIHYEHWRSFEEFKALKGGAPSSYQPPEEDKQGYSRWIMWDFMETYGSFIGMGRRAVCSNQVIIYRRFASVNTSSPLVGPSKGTV